MPQLIINKELCRGCTICTRSCGSDALHMRGRLAEVNDNCILCGICVKSCPFGAITIEKEEKINTEMDAYKNLWVFVEINQNRIAEVSLELLGIGRKLADEKGCHLVAVVLDENALLFAEDLISYGADKLIVCNDKGIGIYAEESCAHILDDLVEKEKPEIFLFGATGVGRSLAPRVAAQAKTGLTADCTVLEIDGDTGLLRQTRPAFGGNIMATIVCLAKRPQMSTVRAGVMAKMEYDRTRSGTIQKVSYQNQLPEAKRIILETSFAPKTNSITDAEFLVVVGRGIGAKKNMKLVHTFAEKIGAQVAVSRPLVDMGYAEYPKQVGQTGCTVAPKLLISLGVSGAIQHLAGITRAEKIIAVNADDTAPIFGISHYKVVGDCVAFLKEYTKD
ncbi:electron transfer flavoprotein subunit alpha [Chakrabartyella piscis]|uniref:electron transfer flavoprotein subunit alpha n=1 Tax=Chakrabartyella piscis TaxID=2918914 RepID=UPI0029586641|nr:electron transfer flavoprotein subunit alpha [Chakrabartyella piscis]